MPPEKINRYHDVEPDLPNEDKLALIKHYEAQLEQGELEPEKRDSDALTGVIEGSRATSTTNASSEQEEAVAKKMADLMEDLGNAKKNPSSHNITDGDVELGFDKIIQK